MSNSNSIFSINYFGNVVMVVGVAVLKCVCVFASFAQQYIILEFNPLVVM